MKKWVTENPHHLYDGGLGGLVRRFEGQLEPWELWAQNSQGILEGDFYSIVTYSRGKSMWVTAT